MDKIDFISELNKNVCGKAICFCPNADNSLTLKIECGTKTAWLTLPCCYETVLNDSDARRDYVDDLVNNVMEMSIRFKKTVEILSLR